MHPNNIMLMRVIHAFTCAHARVRAGRHKHIYTPGSPTKGWGCLAVPWGACPQEGTRGCQLENWDKKWPLSAAFYGIFGVPECFSKCQALWPHALNTPGGVQGGRNALKFRCTCRNTHTNTHSDRQKYAHEFAAGRMGGEGVT